MDATTRRVSRFERWTAAIVGAIPLYYVLTERTRAVFVVTWSKRWTVLVVVVLGLYLLWLASYLRPLPRWIERLRSIVLAAATTIVVLLVGAEIALTVFDRPAFETLDNRGRHAPDPDVGHVFFPNHRQRVQTSEFSIEWRSNAQGLRADRDFGPKPEGVARVLCLGDSFTECAQVPIEEAWPSVMQRCFDETLGAGRVEVVNAGFPGYSTAVEALWLAKFGPAFEPDLVLVAMTPNDLFENQTPLLYTARDGALALSTSTEADRLRLEQHLKWWCLPGLVEFSSLRNRLMRSPAYKRMIGARPINHLEAYMVERNEKSQRLYALAEKHLLEARDEAARQGAKFAVLTIPYSQQLKSLGPNLDPTRFGSHWVAFGAAQGFPVVDALPAFAAHQSPQSLHWEEDSHCTAAGYAIVGRETCTKLLSLGADVGLPAPPK